MGPIQEIKDRAASRVKGKEGMIPGMQKCNILIVDDHPENLLAMEAILADLDQNVIRAESGDRALKILLDSDVSVVLLDVKMPTLDGFETAALIRARDRSRHTPIIFITAINTLEEDVTHGYSLGAVDYIFKPFSAEILRTKVNVFVELFKKSEQVRLQAERLHQMELREVERKEQEKRLAEAKRYMETLEKQAKELARSNEDLEQFAYVASHDLQEPLRKIANYTQLLERRYKGRLDANADKYIESIVSGADRMHTLIQNLLMYSRLTKTKIEREPIPLERVLADTMSDLESLIQKTQSKVTHDPLPTIHANAVQMKELFQNLIQNAIKFHGPQPPEVHISAARQVREWVFSVKDNGIGIDPHYFDRIFVIFQRLHSRTEYPGTGIGLAICKKIVERYGGRIWVESEPGTGAKFFFSIPAETNI